ncbi:MAG TPA: MBL fold metallo-hydrolase [Spirochaetota bacterium]|nr:MBL fold metallo-hydrolase [Spirochaetota bacterium]HPC42961.1 MBL fold metallo-hydrolase [Spirochaetota bacterium]HPL18953.1 MBL fold metallo-hydrolase [Spirochaetota bacterium]HQF07624.1 MBL fold metallo-hydrolase [Spirochaetota bacterium]HQH96355.1 MBL fold metallo-hydrolase [Spirochaetota bacterium]
MKIKPMGKRKLTLANRGGLDLFFLGVGSAFTKRHYQTNLIVIKGKDHLLIDCGTRCPEAMHRVGIATTDIRNVLITHSHADHIGGLEELAIMGRYFAKRKTAMVINETYQHVLWETSLRGGLGHNERTAHKVLTFEDFFEVIRPKKLPEYPRETFSAKVGSIDIKMMRTKHIPDTASDWQSSFWSCAVIIDDRVFFSSDTRYDPDLIRYYDERFSFEAIFHDCQFFNGGVHAGIDELNQLPADIKKRLILSHYGDNWEKFEKIADTYGFAGMAKQHVYYSFG